METLSQVVAPHQITDPAKFGKLCSRYQLDLEVTPVVILTGSRGLIAVCGSHRVAALKEVYEDDTEIETLENLGYVLSVDYDDVYNDASDELRGLLDELHNPSGDYYTDLCRALSAELGGEVAAALADQI